MNDIAVNPPHRDPYLDLDLHGLQLIEASAGTGKTFTLATLVTRLVIERELRVGQILAVTFTEAATQELRERLRQRLTLAAQLARGEDVAADATEAALTRELIARRLAYEGAAALQARLQRAAHEIDLAAVFTIHGFCARVLGEHALEAGQPFVAANLVGSDRELRDEVAADLWRAFGSDASDAELLAREWSEGPAALASDLSALLAATEVTPPPPVPAPDPLPALQQAAAALRKAFAQHGDELRARLDEAIAAGVLNANSYKPDLTDALWPALARWYADSRDLGPIHSHIDRLTPQTLALRTKKGRERDTPTSPMCAAVALYLDAREAREEWLADQTIGLVHRLRDDAVARLARLKRVRRVQTFDDLIEGVAGALEGAHGEALVQRLRQQYTVALVDEFQDTDPRQWAIFRRVFGGEGDADVNLFLIGDPKQAIYRFRGGDVHTYLAAARDAQRAPELRQNFRSRPALLCALQALYDRGGETAFVDPHIRYIEVEPGGTAQDADYRRAGHAAPALTLRRLPAPEDGGSWKADDARRFAAEACVAAMHAVLTDARHGMATIRGRPVRAGDLAVLVRDHREATLMQALLNRAGIPAVAAGRQSLFNSEQAREVLALLEALLHPGDEARLRGALAGVWLGADAATLAAFDTDEHLRGQWQLRALDWRERWERHGPLALISDRCAEHAPRLLQLLDGERRLTNLLQLAEVLQEATATALGVHGLVDWLRRRIAEADDFDETQQLRLESDAERVQVMTLHKSKGLEFPLVFLPFAGIGRERKAPRGWCEVLSAQGRRLQLETGRECDAGMWTQAVATRLHEEAAEDARLLYVGLTRAQHALWLACGPLYKYEDTPLARLLGEVDTLPAQVTDAIVLEADPLPLAAPPLPPESGGEVPAARVVARTLSRDWWVYSFTQLANEDSSHAAAATGAEEGAGDEPETAPAADYDRRFSGSRFGNVLHEALERVDFTAWRNVRDAIPPGQEAPLRAALSGGGYTAADSDDGLPVLVALVGATLNAPLPEGVRLCELPEAQRRAEMEFHFALQTVDVGALLATLHAHGVLRERHAFGLRRTLDGLMTGKIDLVYTLADGRTFLLDYKSNRLPAYDPATLDAAMDDSEYTLQALIYTLALHRWLRFRLGADYDYERHFGGVRYLYCRGLDVADPVAGVHAHTPPRALVEALDALFAGGAA
ncbi:exodeoxyribonuclease V subunit beta [Lysobacter solisilvae (ex Woo and Kim 2020)]|uniref:RecBCD enzyme subunit RecB n=1 Tax=Agrilutibacter terrestris TaxID=2865112 RepID=A0A7H0FTN7_9GAMM|nr:exodeoxyribonuclease V subunit beta [Lysobacter terrestris]QNP39403.1 exodeoxyribonuclease V subunit beta [Lysobacter terrestris]